LASRHDHDEHVHGDEAAAESRNLRVKQITASTLLACRPSISGR
jgi:hypothetical protein